MSHPAPKSALGAEEALIWRARLAAAEPHEYPEVGRCDEAGVLRLDCAGTLDNAWGGGAGGRYVLTSGVPVEGGILHDPASFLHAHGCLRALWGVAHAVPNFPTVGGADPVLERPVAGVRGGRALFCEARSLPLSGRSLADLLGSAGAASHEVFSVYLQAAHAAAYAHDTLRFGHNALAASNVRLAGLAPVFGVNYGGAGVLGLGWCAVLTNFHHAHYSYVRPGGRVAHVLPPLGGAFLHLEPHPSADLYSLTASCARLSGELLGRLPRADPLYTQAHARARAFREILGYYLPRPEAPPYPPGVAPHGDARGFLRHAAGVLERAGYRLVYGAPPHYGNPHLGSRGSTWYAADLRALVARAPPPADPAAAAAEAEGAPGPLSAHEAHPATEGADAAARRLEAAPHAPEPADLRAATAEYPALLCLPPPALGALLRSPAGGAHWEAGCALAAGWSPAPGLTLRALAATPAAPA